MPHNDGPGEEHELRSLVHQEEETRTMDVLGIRNTYADTSDGRESDGGNDRTSLDRRTVRKLDTILLPFLALLFLLNSLDKSNIGNAESAGFTRDVGLAPEDLNYALAAFFAVFVALQPVGAALGRKFGMGRYVPICMSLWGLSTILHIFVKKRWQLICLRIAIAALESGFYPTAVSYLSLFYTRYEFAVRLGVFYGQTAVAGVLGGLLSWAVFSRFPDSGTGGEPSTDHGVGVAGDRRQGVVVGKREDDGWKSWEVLFLIEGCLTVMVALVGFFWLPRSAEDAWFLSPSERIWAENRIRIDRESGSSTRAAKEPQSHDHRVTSVDNDEQREQLLQPNDRETDEAYDRLLFNRQTPEPPTPRPKHSTVSLTADSGLSRHDITSALLNYKIWHLLICNILSVIPATAFGVFLPLVVKQLSPALSLSPAASNLLSAPPFACGAVVLFIFARWSDRDHQRLVPIFWSLGLLLIGLTLTLLAPISNYILKYIALCVLLSGSFVASPLTVAWLSDNTPEPGKRAILLGINGWGNLAGVFSALLFTPADAAEGYIRPFVTTFICVLAAFVGFITFRILLVRENKWRDNITTSWSEGERVSEDLRGNVELPQHTVWRQVGGDELLRRLGLDESLPRRRGDEKMTFRFGL